MEPVCHRYYVIFMFLVRKSLDRIDVGRPHKIPPILAYTFKLSKDEEYVELGKMRVGNLYSTHYSASSLGKLDRELGRVLYCWRGRRHSSSGRQQSCLRESCFVCRSLPSIFPLPACLLRGRACSMASSSLPPAFPFGSQPAIQ